MKIVVSESVTMGEVHADQQLEKGHLCGKVLVALN
jgi:hypothetical protein